MKNEVKKERLLELLADNALFGLNETESKELKNLQKEFPEFKEDSSFEKAALAINLSNLDTNQEMPHNLQAKILRDADIFFESEQQSPVSNKEREKKQKNNFAPTFGGTDSVFNSSNDSSNGSRLMQWLGWGVAALACIALVANIWLARTDSNNNIANKDTKTIETPEKEPTVLERKQQFLASADDVIKTDWTAPDDTNKDFSGEIVWSDERQEGYMTFKGLAKNDVDKETYQLWIFSDEKLEPHPIDGGVFDVNESGEVIVPIDAKLEVKDPKVFAVTVEKPGGVVVSERGKIAALAKV